MTKDFDKEGEEFNKMIDDSLKALERQGMDFHRADYSPDELMFLFANHKKEAAKRPENQEKIKEFLEYGNHFEQINLKDYEEVLKYLVGLIHYYETFIPKGNLYAKILRVLNTNGYQPVRLLKVKVVEEDKEKHGRLIIGFILDSIKKFGLIDRPTAPIYNNWRKKFNVEGEDVEEEW